MSFFQNLWRDLVDKHLWPVALVLLLAAIAVPFLIDTGSSDPAVATAPVAAVDPGATPIGVAVAPGDTPVARPGTSRDPFKPLVFAKIPKAPAAATAAVATAATAATATRGGATAAPGSPAGGSASSSRSAGSTSASPAPPTAATTTPKATTTTRTRLLSYAIRVDVKRSGSTTRRRVRAVSYLPSAAYPLVAFLGVKSDGHTASFLLMQGVYVVGDRDRCVPSKDACKLVELKTGDNVLLARVPPAGQPLKRFRIVLRGVALTAMQRKPAAKTTTRATRSSAPVDLLTTLGLAGSRQVRTTRATR